jgi:phage terminase small subunit
MAMTAKQEAFCLALIKGDNALAAYRAAGYSVGMSDKTATEAASRLMRNSNVLARLAALRAPAAQRARMTLESHLGDLETLRDIARQRGQLSAAIAAEIARGKASGVHVEKTESTVTTKELPASIDEFVMPPRQT